MELSIVIPCLNEEETIAACLKKASFALENNKINYEIIIADNGSTDNSINIALSFPKVKIISVKKKGYGIALRTGIAHAQGKYILIADADDSYDLGDAMKFLNKIRSGYQLVQGCRFPSGGGTIMEGAMPISHRIFGNPFLSKIAQIIYEIPFKDIYCGMRCFEKEIYLKKNYFSEGMTFAVENLIKLVNSGAKSTEVGITLHKDGRIKNKSHLKTIRDGFKTLKLLLICSPKWLYFYPSILIFFLGLNEGYSFFLNNNYYKNFEITDYIKIIKINFMLMLSIQIFSLGIFTALTSYQIGLQKKNAIVNLMKYFNLKKLLILLTIFAGLLIYFSTYKFNIISENLKYFLIYNSSFLLGLIFFNALFISLLELVRVEKD
jgi:glycosyltransferase involved in cell wall biosynthesis